GPAPVGRDLLQPVEEGLGADDQAQDALPGPLPVRNPAPPFRLDPPARLGSVHLAFLSWEGMPRARGLPGPPGPTSFLSFSVRPVCLSPSGPRLLAGSRGPPGLLRVSMLSHPYSGRPSCQRSPYTSSIQGMPWQVKVIGQEFSGLAK